MKTKSKKSKSKLPAKTDNLRVLAEQDVKFAKMAEDGTCTPRHSKAGATHAIVETDNRGVLTQPLAKLKKRKGDGSEAYGPARIPDEKPLPDGQWHPPIPEGADWVQYCTSVAQMLIPITMLNDLRFFRGKIRFGRLKWGEDFVSLMPGEVGNITRWSDGVTVFAEGNSPDEIKAKAASMAKRAERLANPPAHVKAAFAANVERRKAAPGPRPDDVPGVVQCGVRKPGAASATGKVWEVADGLMASLKRVPTKAEVVEGAAKFNVNPSTGATQFSCWRRFHGHP